MNKLNIKGQSLLELVIGLTLISVIIGALAILTTYSLRNTQFSKNQSLATKLAQENMEKVRAIKNSNSGVCIQGDNSGTDCHSWEEIWNVDFSAVGVGSTYSIINNCKVVINGITSTKDYCLQYKAPAPSALWTLSNNLFTGEITLANETASSNPDPNARSKRVISTVTWTDNSGEHSSDLVTVFSKY